MHIYMATDTSGALFNYRGETGPNDEPESFKRKMEAQGFDVILKMPSLVHQPITGKNIPREVLEAN